MRLQLFGYRLLPLTLCILLAYGAYQALPYTITLGWAGYLKLRGSATHCDWTRVALLIHRVRRFNAHLESARPAAARVVADPQMFQSGRVRLSDGDFWIRTSTQGAGIAYLIAEHRWMTELNGDRMVRPGDIVLDIGAHVGFFVKTALRQGAAKVVAVEPDPYSIECLRRNFPEEIAMGRVIIVPAGAWSSPGEITLHLGADPGWNSMVNDQTAGDVQVPVKKIDDIVAELGLPSVDFIKMDIEGAEKEALRGALGTLQRFQPRIMIDTYQWAHDLDGLLAEVRQGHSRYAPYCGPCELTPSRDAIVPHMTFYEVRRGA